MATIQLVQVLIRFAAVGVALATEMAEAGVGRGGVAKRAGWKGWISAWSSHFPQTFQPIHQSDIGL